MGAIYSLLDAGVSKVVVFDVIADRLVLPTPGLEHYVACAK